MPMTATTDASERRLLGGLGLCLKARALVMGTPMVCEALQKKTKPHLVLEASDTSPATHKKLCDKCNFYGVRHIRLPIRGAALASALGKSSTLAAVAVTDSSLLRVVQNALDAMEGSDLSCGDENQPAGEQ
jgi:ribosomal protein L7Ae-like RNA K-turn-binding protein